MMCSALAGLVLVGCSGQEDNGPTPLPPSATLPSPDSEESTGSAPDGTGSPTPTAAPSADDTLVRESALRIAQTYMGYAAEVVRVSRGQENGADTELFAWLRESPEAWVTAASDLAAEAALSGLSATVDGVAAESLTSEGLTIADGLLIGVSDGTTTCVVEATFLEAGSVVSMAWAGPTCSGGSGELGEASVSPSAAAP